MRNGEEKGGGGGWAGLVPYKDNWCIYAVPQIRDIGEHLYM